MMCSVGCCTEKQLTQYLKLILQDEVSESRMRVTSLIEQVQCTHDKRSALYQSYADAINKYKANKDTTSFHANRKKIDTDHKNLTQQIGALQTKLKADNAEVGEKVGKIKPSLECCRSGFVVLTLL
jgi:oligosaccharyltransferase complex subunit alpha (ribophorin I)